ncbi:MAG: hypothetical protein ACLQVY_02220 [Limisphaerales bacterium]
MSQIIIPADLDSELRRSICPLWKRCRRYPEFIGSSVLLTLGGRFFIITAQHVVDAFEGKSLNVGNSQAFRPIVGEIYSSAALKQLDICYIQIHPDIAVWLSGDYRFLRAEQVSASDHWQRSSYHFFGIPFRKVGDKPKNSLFTFPVYSYSSFSIDCAEYAANGLSPDAHVAVDFVERKVRDATGRTITAPNPEERAEGPFSANQTTTNTIKMVIQ